MDRLTEQAADAVDSRDTPQFTKRIGNTTYTVSVHFSKTSTETMADKVKRLIQNEALLL